MKKKLICKQCGMEFEKDIKEYNRRIKLGKTEFFCGNSCSMIYKNSQRTDLRQEITKECPYCGKKFVTLTGSKESTFCSRECASSGSMTEYRIKKAKETSENNKSFIEHKGSIQKIANILKTREASKYIEIEKFLESKKIKHEFEFVLKNFIYDLCIEKYKILIEFDEDGHNYKNQIIIDKKKDKVAIDNGYSIERIVIKKNEKIYSEKEVAFLILNKII